MNIKYNDNSFCGDNSLTLFYFPPWYDEKTRELERQYRSEHDPERSPRPERGDVYIVIGAIVGLIVGGVLGTFGGLFGIAGGAIAGAIIGATIGDLIRKRREKTKTNAQKPF